MRRFLLYMLLLTVSLPAFAAENELKIGVTTSTRYTDNVNNVASGENDSFAFGVGPRLQFESAASQYEAGLTYAPHFTTYTSDLRRDEISHNASLHGDYRPTERLAFRISDALRVQTDNDRDLTSDGLDDQDNGKDKRTIRNDLSADARYGISQRMSISTNVGYTLNSRQDKDLSDSNQVSGRVSGEYQASPRNSAGSGVTARRQFVDGSREEGADTTTDFYGFFVFWDHRFTPLFRANVSGGPTWLISNRDGDGQKSDTKVNYFANAGLTADYDGGSASLSYERSSSDFALSSTTFLIDVVNVRAEWAITRLLGLGVTGEWSQRDSILKTERRFFSDKVVQWRAAATVTYKLTQELASHFSVDYLRQDDKDAPASDRFRVVVRFDYNARAFRF